MPLFSGIRTVRIRKKKPKSPKSPTKPPLRRLKSKIRKACRSMANRFRPHRPDPSPGNTNSNNNVVSGVTPIRSNVAPSGTSLSSQKSVPVRPTVPISVVVRPRESGGGSKPPQPPPSTGVLPSKIKIPSGTTLTRKQSGISSPAANSQKNTGVSQTAHNAVRSSSPRPSRRGSMDSPAVKDHLNGSPSTVRRKRSNSLVTVPSSVTSTPKKDPQSGKIPIKRSASFSGPRMSAAQPGVLLPKRKSPPPYVLPLVCTQKTKNLKDLTGQKPKEAKSDVDFTGQKAMAPKGVKTDVMSPVKTIPRSPSHEWRTKEREETVPRGPSREWRTKEREERVPPSPSRKQRTKEREEMVPRSPSRERRTKEREETVHRSPSREWRTKEREETVPRSPSRERRTKERQEKQRASRPVMVKPVASSSTPKPLPPLPPQSQRPAKSNSPASLSDSGSIKMGALRRVSDSSSCGSGRPSPALPRKENGGVQSGLNWSTGNSGHVAKATAVAVKAKAVAAKTASISGISSPVLSWQWGPTPASQTGHVSVATGRIYPGAPWSTEWQNPVGLRPPSPSRTTVTVAWFAERLQYSTAESSSSSKMSSSLSIWGAKGGVVGIYNLGNTCYMNCMLQCLGHTPEMTELFLNRGKTGVLTGHYVKLMMHMWFPSKQVIRSSLYPRDLKMSIANLHPEFYGTNQHDAQEFLRFLLGYLQDEWLAFEGRSARRLPWISEDTIEKLSVREMGKLLWNNTMYMEDTPLAHLFMGQLLSSLKCASCGYTSTTFDPIWDLALPFPEGTTNKSIVDLMDCFRTFNKKEVLDGNNKPFCNGCLNFQRCCKSLSIQRAPPILVLHLKRFFGPSQMKLEATVQIPYRLNITEFLTDEVANEYLREPQPQHCCYELYAMVDHCGDRSWGHYTATYKHHTTDDWYTISDNNVCICPKFSPTSTIKSKAAYVLFYRQAVL